MSDFFAEDEGKLLFGKNEKGLVSKVVIRMNTVKESNVSFTFDE